MPITYLARYSMFVQTISHPRIFSFPLHHISARARCGWVDSPPPHQRKHVLDGPSCHSRRPRSHVLVCAHTAGEFHSDWLSSVHVKLTYACSNRFSFCVRTKRNIKRTNHHRRVVHGRESELGRKRTCIAVRITLTWRSLRPAARLVAVHSCTPPHRSRNRALAQALHQTEKRRWPSMVGIVRPRHHYRGKR